MTIDVVIPTYKPDEKLLNIIDRLSHQTVPIRKIIIVNTEQKYIENLLRGRDYDKYGKLLDIKNISLWEFDHGATRNVGASLSDAEFLLFMTQDAIPNGPDLVECMLKAFDDEKVASCYARQIPNNNATLAEQFSRKFNYPEDSFVKSKEDKARLGIKTYFCSNACAMYRKDIFDSLGAFPKDMIFNEDMVFAYKVIEAGYLISYAADAKVIHSHNYTNSQQFHRNFDLGVSQAMHKEVFDGVSSEAEGSSYAKSAFDYFVKNHHPLTFIPFAFTCFCRLLGYKLGRNYEKLSHGVILRCTMSPVYFKKHWS